MKAQILALLLALAPLALAQQTINGNRDIVGNLTVAGVKTLISGGTTLPGACVQRSIFFKTDSTAGQNLHLCTATGVWTQLVPGVGGGSGLINLNGLTATSQTFSTSNDTNMSLTVTSTTANHAFSLAWVGTLAKSRQFAATAYTDQANTWGAFLQDYAASSMILPRSAGAAPTANGAPAYDTTTHSFRMGFNGVAKTIPNLNATVTTNKIVKFNGSAELEDTVLTESASTGQVTSTRSIVQPHVPVAFSTTPVFDASLGSTFEMTLTNNVTSSTITNVSAGQELNFVICQDATGGRTFAWPAGFALAVTISPTISDCTSQKFVYNGTTYLAVGVANVTNAASGPGTSLDFFGSSSGYTRLQGAATGTGAVLTLPAAAGTLARTVDNVATATALAANPAACSAGQYVSDIAADGTLTCGTPAGGGGGVTKICNLVASETNTTGGGVTPSITCNIGAGTLTAGQVIRVHASGTASAPSSAQFRYNLQLGGTDLWLGDLTSVPAFAGLPWVADLWIQVRTVGASGTVLSGGMMHVKDSGADDGETFTFKTMIPRASSVTVNTTAALSVKLDFTYTTAASREWTINTFIVTVE